MLGAGAKPADRERDKQRRKTSAGAGQAIAESGQRSAKRQHRGGAEPLRQKRSRNLHARHRAGEDGAQQAERRVGQAEFGLPKRQHDVDQIGVAVVQRVSGARDGGGAPLVAGQLSGTGRKYVPGQPAHKSPSINYPPKPTPGRNNLTFESFSRSSLLIGGAGSFCNASGRLSGSGTQPI